MWTKRDNLIYPHLRAFMAYSKLDPSIRTGTRGWPALLVSRTVPGCSYKLATPRRKQRVDTNTMCTDRYANARTKHVKSSRRNAENRTNEGRQVETDKIRGHG
jgi:hypothetical protein